MDRRRYPGELIIEIKSDLQTHWFLRRGVTVISALIFVLASLYPISQTLANDSTEDASKNEAIMFGGFGSTNGQMKAWEKSAAADSNRAAAFNFHAVALPSRYFSQAEVKRDA